MLRHENAHILSTNTIALRKVLLPKKRIIISTPVLVHNKNTKWFYEIGKHTGGDNCEFKDLHALQRLCMANMFNQIQQVFPCERG
uniref:Uncharacterized protein n=1 Tax=Anguilla anguilla TaxID=7936 RepID=A0A0E9TLT1_ANGAN